MRITHKELVDVGAKWLYNKGYRVVLKELVSASMESPDVLGFQQHCSFLLEAKTSVADFRADKKKLFRHYTEMGVGFYRSYICPKDLIKPEELPEGWGLIYVTENLRSRQIVKPKPFVKHGTNAEIALLTSLLRRFVDGLEYQKYLYKP